MATRDCTVCGESWDDTSREFGTAVISPCPGHNIVRRSSPNFTSFEIMRSKLADSARRTPPNRQRLDPFAGGNDDQKENIARSLAMNEEPQEPPPHVPETVIEMASREVSESRERSERKDGVLSAASSFSKAQDGVLSAASSFSKPPSPTPFNFQLPPSSISATATASAPPPGGVRGTTPVLSQPLPNVVPSDFPLVNNPPTSIPHDALPNSNLLSKALPASAVKEKKKKSSLDTHWNCGGILCSFRCIGHSIAGLWTKNGWFKSWWGAIGNKKYLTREEFETSLNSYAELLRLVDFYIVQRETGKIMAKDMKKYSRKTQHKKSHVDMALSSQDMRERQDQYLEALIIGIACLLRSCGSPTWRLDYQLRRVAEGLGLKGMTFIVFPSFILATLPSERESGMGSKTLCFDTRYGYDMAKLTAADNLARAIAALATNTDNFENMVVPALANDVQKLVVSIANSPERLDQVYGFSYDNKTDVPRPPRMRMRASLEDAGSYMAMLMQQLGSHDAAVTQLKARVMELAHHGTGFFSFDIPRISKELDPNWDPDGKLEQFYELRKTAFLEISLEFALTELDKIEAGPPSFSKFIQVLFGGITAGAAVGMWFGGGWWDVLLTFVLGGAIQYLGGYSNAITFIRMYECIASFVVGLLSVVGAVKFPDYICYQACSIASVINIVQGVSITMAVVELATKNMISGTSRLFYSLLLSVIIGIGTYAGAQFGLTLLNAFDPEPTPSDPPTTCHPPLAEWWAWIILLPFAAFCWSGMFGAGLKEMPSMLVAMFIAYGVSVGTTSFGDSVSNILSAFCVGVFSNLLQKVFPSFTPFMPIVAGLMILVPGAMAVRGVDAMAREGALQGLTITFRVLFTALTLGLGCFLSSLAITPTELLGWRNPHLRTLEALTI